MLGIEATGDTMTDDSAAADSAELIAAASRLVNPASGIANDFLNHFNEILLLVENLPVLLPEMLDELLAWQPTTYCAYFTRSNLPGTAEALATYDTIDADLRAHFEALVDQLNEQASAIVAEVGAHRGADGSIDADSIAGYCAAASRQFRMVLDAAAEVVNSGHAVTVEAVQSRADRLLANA